VSLSPSDPDMLDLKALLQSAQSVQAAGDKQYKGTLDLAKGENAPGAAKAQQLKLSVTRHGTATVPAKPTGKAVADATPGVYEFVNS
jgi:hypothetical protein